MISSATTRTVQRTCHICEVSCGLSLDVAGDGTVVRVRGDAEDTYSAGYVCAKGMAIGALDADPDRLLQPLVRVDGELRVATWDEAFDTVDRLLGPLLERDRSSVALFTGNPSGHNFAGTLLQPVLEAALGSRNLYSVSTLDQMPQVVAAGLMYGTPTSVPIADVDRTDYMLIVGANPLVSNGSLGAGPRYPQRLKAVRDRGGTVVVVDPVATRTARAADRHVAIRPGTDVLFLLSIVRELFERGLVDLGAAEGRISGLDVVRSVVGPFEPNVVAPRCDVPVELITTIAVELATASSAVVYGRTGTTLNRFGTPTSWAIQLLNVLTGNLDRPGGAMFTTPAVGSRTTLPKVKRAPAPTFGRYRSRVRQAPEVLGELPAASLAEDILTPGHDRIRGLITFAGNVARSMPNSGDVEQALDSLDALVCIDPYLNETTRHAHVILPPAPPLTRSHYDIALYAFAIRNVANFSPPVYDVPDGAMAEWDVLLRLIGILEGAGPKADTETIEQRMNQDLAERISRQQDIAADDVLAATPGSGPERLLDLRLRSGPYGDLFGRRPGGLSLAVLREQPHGIDFGPLVPRLDEVLAVSPHGKVQLAPLPIVDDLDRVRELLHSEPPEGMVLLGRRGLRSMNSSLHNVDGLAGKDRSTLQVHPDDAHRLGIDDGGRAEVRSVRAALTATVEVTADIKPGVCSLPHGFGHDAPGTRQRLAQAHPGANANLLTDHCTLDELSGTAELYGTPVTIRPAPGGPGN